MSGTSTFSSSPSGRKPLTPDLPFLSTEGLTPLRPEPPSPSVGLAPLGPFDGLRPLVPERVVPPGTHPASVVSGEVLASARRRATELDWSEPTGA